jgi:hypothetical protein
MESGGASGRVLAQWGLFNFVQWASSFPFQPSSCLSRSSSANEKLLLGVFAAAEQNSTSLLLSFSIGLWGNVNSSDTAFVVLSGLITSMGKSVSG